MRSKSWVDQKAAGAAAALVVAILFALGSVPAHAHGPTVRLSDREMKPPLLNLFVGTTVHFEVAQRLEGWHVVVDEAAGIQSPELTEPGDGWHYTFDSKGTYEVFLREFPDARTRIVVIPKRGPGGSR